MPDAFELPVVDDTELLELEAIVQQAQRARSLDGLRVLGFGEVSIALGWPLADPRFVAKRLIPVDNADDIDEPLAAIDDFVEQLRARGGKVLPYSTRRIQRGDGAYVGYLVQPVVDRAELAETVLKNDPPAAFHPLLVAVRDYVARCTDDHMALGDREGLGDVGYRQACLDHIAIGCDQALDALMRMEQVIGLKAPFCEFLHRFILGLRKGGGHVPPSVSIEFQRALGGHGRIFLS